MAARGSINALASLVAKWQKNALYTLSSRIRLPNRRLRKCQNYMIIVGKVDWVAKEAHSQ